MAIVVGLGPPTKGRCNGPAQESVVGLGYGVVLYGEARIRGVFSAHMVSASS